MVSEGIEAADSLRVESIGRCLWWKLHCSSELLIRWVSVSCWFSSTMHT